MKELSEKQERAIQMLCTGDYTKPEIAQECGVDRTTIYNWLKDKEFSAKLDEALQEIRTQTNKEFTSKLPKAIQEYWLICTKSTDVRTKEKALANWIDRSLGRITTTLNVNDERQEDNVDILAAFENAVKGGGVNNIPL